LKAVFDIVGDIHSIKILPFKEGETKTAA